MRVYNSSHICISSCTSVTALIPSISTIPIIYLICVVTLFTLHDDTTPIHTIVVKKCLISTLSHDISILITAISMPLCFA